MEKTVTRLYTGFDGESHFDDIKIPLEVDPRDPGLLCSELMKVTNILFVEPKTGNLSIGWHNAPRRQFVILLEGREEIEIGDGTKRQFGPGDILLVEDTTGRGHKVSIIGNQLWKHFDVALE